jgi:Helix-turn-helix domain
MSVAHSSGDRIDMSQRERDRLKVLQTLIDGQRTQTEAARLLRLTTRQVRRLVQRLRTEGDAALVHGLRGKPSNRQADPKLRKRVVREYKKRFHDFGPTLASEKLAELGLNVSADTLRRWLLAEGLWQRRRRRDVHRSRRPRRSCFGELIQIDTSIHEWTEGRGEPMVLIHMIDDATSRLLARFYPADTVEAHLDLLGRWLAQYGRPLALYSDRHSIFQAQNKGEAVAEGETQFGRALRELDIELIWAYSPQAKGRVERSFGTAQDRWVKEMRLAKVRTIAQANELLEKLLPAHNQRFRVPPRDAADAHRSLGPGYNVAAILSVQHERVVSNDYTVRFQNRFYQLGKPIYPGERGGRVVIELRLDGTMAIRLGDRYLNWAEVAAAGDDLGGAAPQTPRSLPLSRPTPGGEEQGRSSGSESAAPGVQPSAGRSGRTPAEPYPPDGGAEDSKKKPRRPAANHPWRKGLPGKK